MLIGLLSAALVCGALIWELAWPSLRGTGGRAWARACERADRLRVHSGGGGAGGLDYDPGRERRAEQRARRLLRSCVNEHEWAMYRDLGFLRVWGHAGERYAYLIYPHKPIVAYVPQTGVLLNEYCVAFPDHSRPPEAERYPPAAGIPVSAGSPRLPDSDDVLAKWIALIADERKLIAEANMHLLGRQIDPRRVGRDLERLAAWERERAREREHAPSPASAGLRSERNGLLAGSVRTA